MKIEFKQTGFAFLVVYAIALILAVLGRIGLAVLDSMGGITYDYIAASHGPILAQMLTVFTGVQLYGFMCAMGLLCVIFVAGNVILGLNYSSHRNEAGKLSTALVWGGLTTLVGLLCFAIIVKGLLSEVQMASMKTKVKIDGGMILMAIVAILAMATLFASASAVIYACIAKSGNRKTLGIKLIAASAGWGLVVVLLSVLTFKTVNAEELNGMASVLWFGVSAAVNAAMALAAVSIAKRG